MKTIFCLKAAVCLLVVGLACFGSATPSSHAAVITDGNLDGFSATNPLGLRPGCHFEMHRVKLVAGTQYIISLNSNQFDPYLIMTGPGVHIEDDDSGGNLNARIVFTPQNTATYNIFSTSFNRGSRGSYRISVTP